MSILHLLNDRHLNFLLHRPWSNTLTKHHRESNIDQRPNKRHHIERTKKKRRDKKRDIDEHHIEHRARQTTLNSDQRNQLKLLIIADIQLNYTDQLDYKGHH